jgi:hypothetical protein
VVILAGRGILVRYVVAGQTTERAHEGERYRGRSSDWRTGWRGSLVTFDDRTATGPGCSHSSAPTSSCCRTTRASGHLGRVVDAWPPATRGRHCTAPRLVDGRCGVVVPHEEPEAMADALQRLLTDRRFAASCVAAARLETARHAWPVVGHRYDELLRSVENHHAPVEA